jgi:hypothetical protein
MCKYNSVWDPLSGKLIAVSEPIPIQREGERTV